MKFKFCIFLILVMCGIALFSSNARADNEAACLQAYNAKKPEAYKLCAPLADAEHPEFQRIMGDFFYFGWDGWVTEDHAEALRWYKRAGMNGDTEAKYKVGVLFDTASGVGQDKTLAFKWYLSAAKDGYAPAQLNTANMYYKGEGMKIGSKNQASYWYMRAANQGDVQAMYNLGLAYAKGEGAPVDYVESYKWLKLAIKGKMREASSSLRAVIREMSDREKKKGEKAFKSFKIKKEDKPI